MTIPLAQAKFMLEPTITYSQGSFSVADRSGDFNGKTFGLRTGYLGQYFMAGLSIEKGQYFYDDTLTTNSYEQYDGGGIGTFIGFHFLDRFRILTSYMNSSLEPIDNNSTRFFGQYVSLSLGYRIYDGLMLNYTEFRNQYTQIEDDDTGETEGLTNNIRESGGSVSLSYILAFE